MRLGDVRERERVRHAQGELALRHQRGQLPQRGPVGADQHVRHPDPPQRRWRDTADDRHERTAAADRVQGRQADDRRVERTVHPAGHGLPDRLRERRGPRHEHRRAQAAQERLVAVARDSDHAQPPGDRQGAANPPTAPAAPVTSTVCPGANPSRSSACSAVDAFSGRVADATRSVPGAGATASASRTTCSACALAGRSSRSDRPITRSPTATSSAPASSTTPATSQPMPTRSPPVMSPAPASAPTLVPTSTGFTPAASTRIRTCPGPVPGTGTSATSSTSGPRGLRRVPRRLPHPQAARGGRVGTGWLRSLDAGPGLTRAVLVPPGRPVSES